MKRTAALLALAAALLAGQVASAAQSEPTAQASATKVVGIDHFEFHPPTLSIAKGTRVTFSNSSKVTHTATDEGAFDTGRIKPGHSATVRFGQKGTFAYHCKIHPSMHGRIVVG